MNIVIFIGSILLFSSMKAINHLKAKYTPIIFIYVLWDLKTE